MRRKVPGILAQTMLINPQICASPPLFFFFLRGTIDGITPDVTSWSHYLPLSENVHVIQLIKKKKKTLQSKTGHSPVLRPQRHCKRMRKRQRFWQQSTQTHYKTATCASSLLCSPHLGGTKWRRTRCDSRTLIPAEWCHGNTPCLAAPPSPQPFSKTFSFLSFKQKTVINAFIDRINYTLVSI